MRHQNGSIFQDHKIITSTGRALRLASNGCAWIGEAFIGFSILLLCQARELEGARHPSERQEGVLLPGARPGLDRKMVEIKLLYHGCRRMVIVLYEIGGFRRCIDCVEIAQENGVQFDNAAMS